MSAERFSATSDTTDAATSITKGAGVEIAVEGLSINTVEGRGHPGRAVLSDVHLNVTRGAALAIVGPSGAGKTTLVRALIGEVAEGLRVVGGKITIDGVNPLSLRSRELRSFRRRCSYVDQDPGAALPPGWSVRQIIRQRAGLSGHGSGSASGTMRDLEILDLLGAFGLANIEGILERTPKELSGGQRRRLGIAAGIAGQPELLLIDEPTAGVDKAAAQVMLDSLKIAREQSGATCVVITHDLEVAKALADRVMRIGDIGDAAGYSADRTAANDLAVDGTATNTRSEGNTAAPNKCGNDTILEVVNLALYHGDAQVLNEFNLSVQRGEIVGISGPSGCGKTTLLRSILGLHPASNGKITVSAPGGIGWIPQESELSLNPSVPIVKTLRRAASGDKRAESRKSRKIPELLSALDLPDFLSTPKYMRQLRPDHLSGGQRQRVSMARALLSRPTLLLADEPTSALDRTNAARVIAALCADSDQRATVVVSHDPAVLSACDRVVELTADIPKPVR